MQAITFDITAQVVRMRPADLVSCSGGQVVIAP
jgi:hypothetical protein